MGWHLYCVGPSGLPLPAVPGIDGTSPELVRVGSTVACVSACDARPEPTVARIRSHHAVVRAACARGFTPLPVRFGQWFASTETLAERLGGAQDALLRTLAAVRGSMEFTVRLWSTEARPATSGAFQGAAAGASSGGAPAANGAAAGAGSGTAFMRSLARRYGDERTARELGLRHAAELARSLGPLVRSERVEEHPPRDALAAPDGQLLSVAHLVPSEHSGRYREEARRFGATRPSLRLEVHGPYPPYSFVT